MYAPLGDENRFGTDKKVGPILGPIFVTIVHISFYFAHFWQKSALAEIIKKPRKTVGFNGAAAQI